MQISYHGLKLKMMIVTVVSLLFVAVVVHSLVAPDEQTDLCKLFRTHPEWYWSAQVAEKRWGVPVSVQMAIIYYESRFRADAKPPHGRVMGVVPWARKSTASGYMQALDKTWHAYLVATQKKSASRSNFSNATDFIGWYVSRLHRTLKIKKDDVYNIYLAYHEGPGGFLAHRYVKKPWLVALARTVQWRANQYHKQLVSCHRSLPKRPWWRVW